jgi:hypothetical protein
MRGTGDAIARGGTAGSTAATSPTRARFITGYVVGIAARRGSNGAATGMIEGRVVWAGGIAVALGTGAREAPGGLGSPARGGRRSGGGGGGGSGGIVTVRNIGAVAEGRDGDSGAVGGPIRPSEPRVARPSPAESSRFAMKSAAYVWGVGAESLTVRSRASEI